MVVIVLGVIVFAASFGGLVRGIRSKSELERKRIFYNAYMVTYNNRRLPGFEKESMRKKPIAQPLTQPVTIKIHAPMDNTLPTVYETV